MAKQKKKVAPPMGFVEFSEKYADEETCRAKLMEVRRANNWCCPKCGNDAFYEIKSRGTFQCKKCRHQTSLTAGTVMEGTHLAIKTWFWAMYLVATDKRGYSAMGLQRQLHIGYKSAWFLLHRIREAMMDRDGKYFLQGVIEFDDSYFGGTKPGSKRGRGTKKAKALIAVSKDEEGKPKYLKMLVVPNLKGKTIGKFAAANFIEGATIESDALPSYRTPLKEKWLHKFEVFDADKDMLVWLHTIVSNVKAVLQGTSHGLDEKYLQRYLAEISYRFNRRFMQDSIFDHLLAAAALTPPLMLAELKG